MESTKGRKQISRVNRVHCTSSETPGNSRGETTFSSSPCKATRAKKTKKAASVMAAKSARPFFMPRCVIAAVHDHRQDAAGGR